MRLMILMAILLAGFAVTAPALAFFPPAPTEGEARTLKELEKWNSYVDLANELEAMFMPALDAYLETFGHRAEYQPVQGSGLIANYFLVLMERPEEFSRVLDQAADSALQGEGELDRAVRELAPYLQALWANLKRSRDYHLNQGEITPDLPEETGELRVRLDSPEDTHARIFVAYQGFAATYEGFRNTLNQVGQERRQRDILALREKGLVIHPALLEILDAGQALQDYLNVRQISGASPAPLKPDELGPFLDRLESAAKALETALAATVDLEGLSAESLEEFSDQLRVVRDEAGLLVRPSGEGGGQRGTPLELARALGRLVDIYNFME